MRASGEGAIVFVLVLFLVLLSTLSPLKGAQQLKITLSNNPVETGRDVILSILTPWGNYSGQILVRLWISDGRNNTIMEYSSSMYCREGLLLLTIGTSNFQPGLYTLHILLQSQLGSAEGHTEVGIAPEESNLAYLWSKLSQTELLLKSMQGIPSYNEAVMELQARLSNASIMLGDISLKSVYDMDDVKKFSLISEEILMLEGRAWHLYSASFPQRLMKTFEASTSFNSSIAIQFWSRFFSASVWAFPLLLLILPIFMSDFHTMLANMRYLMSYASGGKGDIREKEIIESAIRKVNELIRVAEGSLRIGMGDYLLMIISSILATVGLLTNNIITVIGSMLIAPLIIIALCSGASIPFLSVPDELGEQLSERSRRIFIEGLRNELLMILLSVFISYVTASITSKIIPLVPTQQVLIRSAPNLGDVATAVMAGAVSPIAFIKREYSILAGVAVAIALIPPSSTIGIGIAMSRADITLGATALLIVNIIAIKAMSYAFSKIYPLVPVVKSLYEIMLLRNKDIFKSDLLAYLVANMRMMGATMSVWARLALGLSPYESVTSRVIREKLAKVVGLVLVFLSPSFIALIVSTDVSLGFALFFDFFKRAYFSFAIIYEPFKWVLPLVVLISSIALPIKFHMFRKHMLGRGLLIAISWGSLGYLMGLYAFPRAASILTLSIMGLALLLHSRNKAILASYGLAIFAISVTMIYSVRAFERASIHPAYSNVEDVCKNLISQLLHVKESDFDITYLPDRNTVIVRLYVDEGTFKEGTFRVPSRLIDIAERALRQALSAPKLRVRFEYVVVPGGT